MSTLLSMIETSGYFAVFLLITIENLFPPIPSEILLSFAGFLTTKTELSVFGMILSSTLGSVVGAVLLYVLGRFLDPLRFEKLLNKFHFKKEEVQKTKEWFKNKGSLSVLFCRFIPVLRSLISIPAGMSQMKILPFLVYTAFGSLIWNTALIYAGSILGEHYEKISYMVKEYGIFLFAIGIPVILLIYYKKRKRS